MQKNYWELIYKKKKQLIEWPWSDLIGLVNKFAKRNKKTTRIKGVSLSI